jgi:phytoene desaturase
MFKAWNDVNCSRLKHPKLVQYFNRFATYNGSNPYRAPGILNIIPSLEHGQGVYFPDGGMQAIPQALYHLGIDLGVHFRFNEKITSIIVEEETVKGVQVNNQEHLTFDLVVSNMDVRPTYERLLNNIRTPKKILTQERSSSAVVFYWGVNATFPELELHNILFSEDYEMEFDHLFNQKIISSDPTVYINISSKENPSDAPEGKENWFVMVNAPYNSGQNWDQIVSQTRKSVLSKITRILNKPVEEMIESEATWDPVAIEKETFSYLGSIYGTSSNDRMSAFFRHPNFSQHIKGLYFSGGSVHPGGGIPLSVLSAKIVSELIQ